MGVPASLLPELEDVVQHGSAEKRAETLRRITDLVPRRRAQLQRGTCRAVRRRHRLPDRGDRGQGAGRTRAPPRAVRQCAGRRGQRARQGRRYRGRRPGAEAGRGLPIPISSTLPRPRARRICSPCRARLGISEAVTDILVERGDREVARSIANNQHAQLSDNAFTTLVKRAEQDGVLAEKVGMRTDIPPRLFRELADAGDRGGAAAPARKGQARNPGRDPARACAELPTKSREGRAAQLHRRARSGARVCIKAAQARRSRHRRIRQSRKVRGNDCGAGNRCARCRSRWWTG